MITLDQAVAIVDACFAAGAEHQMHELAAVVTDAGGAVRAAMRSDGQAAFAIDIATAKAQTALGFLKSSLRLSDHFGTHVASTLGVASATRRFVPIGGGVVVVDDRGCVIGGAAVAGGLPTTDDRVVRAALSRTGFGALD